MSIPEEVVIFGRTYEIRDVTPIHCAEGVVGAASYRDGAIYLDQTVDAALGLTTLWHEAIHIAQQEILGEADEAQARWISLFVHTFLAQNPEIVESYAEELHASQGDDDLD
jgi:hypothetical protein